MRMIRSFIAVDMPHLEKLIGLLEKLRSSQARLSVPKDQGMHVTLKFLGDIQEDAVARISNSLGEIASKAKRFEVEIIGTGAFPNAKAPRVLWVGLSDGGRLSELSAEIDAAMAEFGIPREKRPFKPHVTVGRVKSMHSVEDAISILREYASVSFGKFTVSDIRLKKSTLTPSGAIYEDLAVKSLS